MTKTIHFNTSRKYTQHGQRISATLHDDGHVTFFDHDRHIDGQFLHAAPDWPFDAAAVMSAYDGNEYRSTARSWENGMTLDGCNSKFEGRS